MNGPPGAGKSLLASCLPGILPELGPAEALEVSMIQSVAGTLEGGRISRARPFRAPHHSASMAALTGGGLKVKPGEVSLAHLGVLFLDELPEFTRQVLDSLRQPLETGQAVVARDDERRLELGRELRRALLPAALLSRLDPPVVVTWLSKGQGVVDRGSLRQWATTSAAGWQDTGWFAAEESSILRWP